MKLQPLFRKIFQIFCGFFGALFPAFFFARYFSVYRIFENLFVNIQKYAMPNSRVYIDVEKSEGNVTITMRNMSAVELNVRGDELTERFVRGDASRNTEGSGLGLAIARSFTEAQKGSLHIAVDGDLFKVVILWK